MKTSTTSGKIRELRRILGVTQLEFAVAVGGSKDAVASWETGRNRLSAAMARRIAWATGVFEQSLLKRDRSLVTAALPRRPFTRDEYELHRKSSWIGVAPQNMQRHVARCSDTLELLLRAAAAGAEDSGGVSRLGGVLDSFIQWCQQTRTAFRLEAGIDAQLSERKRRLELTKTYAQWRELATHSPELARGFGFKDDRKHDEKETLRLSMETIPVWMPGQGMRGRS